MVFPETIALVKPLAILLPAPTTGEGNPCNTSLVAPLIPPVNAPFNADEPTSPPLIKAPVALPDAPPAIPAPIAPPPN